MKEFDKRKVVVGWIAVGLSTAITCIWAFWGIIENFHEGWYNESMLLNVGLMFVQYLSPMLIFMGITLVSIYRRRFAKVRSGNSNVRSRDARLLNKPLGALPGGEV